MAADTGRPQVWAQLYWMGKVGQLTSVPVRACHLVSPDGCTPVTARNQNKGPDGPELEKCLFPVSSVSYNLQLP